MPAKSRLTRAERPGSEAPGRFAVEPHLFDSAQAGGVCYHSHPRYIADELFMKKFGNCRYHNRMDRADRNYRVRE
jgi:hypothetical protein